MPDFPDDENGQVLRRMYDHGDDLSKPRVVEFFFLFGAREDAVRYARLLDDRELTVAIAWNDECDKWDAVVSKHMVPTHQTITALEESLIARARPLCGEPDGWGCLQVDRK